VTDLLLDAGVLVAVERGNRELSSVVRRSTDSGRFPVVPGVVVAQVWRGGARQARLAQALADVVELPVQRPECRDAGVLCGRTGTSDIVDALVVVPAGQLGRDIVTSDPADIGRLVDAAGSRSRVLAL